MSGHTKGPWSVASEKTMRQQLITGGIAIRAYAKRFDAECAIFNIPANETFGGADEAIANARLIAAAPDLLEALKAMQPLWHHMVGLSSPVEWHRVNGLMEDAIARATVQS